MDYLLNAAPGLPALWEQMHAAAEKRRSTPTSQCVAQPMPEGVRTTDKPGFELSKEVIAMVDEQAQYFVDHIQIRDRAWDDALAGRLS